MSRPLVYVLVRDPDEKVRRRYYREAPIDWVEDVRLATAYRLHAGEQPCENARRSGWVKATLCLLDDERDAFGRAMNADSRMTATPVKFADAVDPKSCANMTIESLDDVERYMRVHLFSRLTNDIDRENVSKSCNVVRRAALALRDVRAAVEDSR